MLVLTEPDIRDLLAEQECIDLMTQAYRELGEGQAQNIPRGRIHLQPDANGRRFWLNCIPGAVPGLGACAVRIDAKARSGFVEGRVGGRCYNDAFTGLVLLFSTETGEWLATLPDFPISALRVASTSALVTNRLARPGASRLGIIGTGKQARAHLTAISAIRPLQEAWVSSSNPEHVSTFCREMADSVPFPIYGAGSGEEVHAHADILVAATNSMHPVVRGEWLRPGMHVVSIAAPDKNHPGRREVDHQVVRGADLVAVNSIEQVFLDHQSDVMEALAENPAVRDRLVEVGDLACGRHPGRSGEDQITLYLNNVGQGIQFAAVAMVIYRRAREQGRGREIPTEWFLTDISEWAAKGLNPT